jgi:hypothetical protein
MAETEETFSAKQIARRIGTDAKTFRKWLRSSASPYPPVGQGKRYEFPKADLERIKLHFDAWQNRGPKGKVAPVEKPETKPATNGASHPKVNEEPPMKRLPNSELVPRKTKEEFMAEREARGKARDKEYGTVDGEEI